MKCLLDTQTLLWIVSDDNRLSAKARRAYLNAENDVFVSLASIWEIAIKISLGKLQIPKTLGAFVDEDVIGNAIQIMNISVKHLVQLESLPFHHRDPFDRLLIAQSISEGMPVVSSDDAFDGYAVKRIW